MFRFGKSDILSILPALSYATLSCSPDACSSHIIFNDGSIKQKSNNEEMRIKNINYSIANLYHKIRDFYTIDEKYLQQVFHFYHEVSRTYPTTIYLSPFHPQLFQTYSNDPRIQNIIQTERLFRQYCGDLNSKGCFVNNSSYIEVDSHMFLDAMHISEAAVKKKFYVGPSTTRNDEN